jgi:hypothetical protein
MIADIKSRIALQFRKFLLVLAIALVFEPLFLLVDSLCDYLRFGEPSCLWEKLLESYLIFYCLFLQVSQWMGLAFQHSLLYGYLLQAVVFKFIYQRFFMERVRLLWFELASSVVQRQEVILSSGAYLLAFAAATKAIRFYKSQRPRRQLERKLQGEAGECGEE